MPLHPEADFTLESRRERRPGAWAGVDQKNLQL